jgi:hypothetical protein
MKGTERYFATTRQVTGMPSVYHAYVYDRMTGRPTMACTHSHVTRNGAPGQRLAQACADRMLKRVLKRPEPHTAGCAQ